MGVERADDSEPSSGGEKIAVLMMSKQIANEFEISVWQMCVVMSQEWMLTNWENKISKKKK